MTQPPAPELEYETQTGAGICPQATVTAVGALTNTAGAAGLTVMMREPLIVLPQASVNVHDSVTVPPQTPGAAV